MPDLPETSTPAVLARLARIEERLDALEAALGQVKEEPRPSEDEVHRLAWAVKHGRQRPW